MKTPFTSKGDMVSELQTAQHYIETLAHNSYDIGFTEGCKYCEKMVYERVLEIISKHIGQFVKNYSLGEFMPDVYALTLVEQDIKALKGGEHEGGKR